jgi:hypothetical protein
MVLVDETWTLKSDNRRHWLYILDLRVACHGKVIAATYSMEISVHL